MFEDGSFLEKATKYVGGFLTGIGLLGAVFTGEVIAEGPEIVQNIENNEKVDMQYKDVKDYGNAINNGLDMETVFLGSSKDVYSLLFTEIEIPYRLEIMADEGFRNRINDMTEYAFEEAVNDIYTLYFTEIDVSDVPKFLLNLYATENNIMENAVEMTMEKANSKHDLQLERVYSKKVNGIYKRSFEGTYEFENHVRFSRDGEIIYPGEDLKVGTDIYAWRSEDSENIYSIVLNYPKEDLVLNNTSSNVERSFEVIEIYKGVEEDLESLIEAL